jgi:hypothetical protein
VKFGKSVTGSVVKVPEKFGFNWSIFGWFGHFTEHVEGGGLEFRGNGCLRCENPPEGAKNLQECSRHIETHIPQHGSTRFHRDLELTTRVEERGFTGLNQREERDRGIRRLLTERGGTSATAGDRRSTAEDGDAGEGRIAEEREQLRRTESSEGKEPLARSRAGGCFLNAIWAHRTVYSACLVHTGQRTVAVR